MIFNCSSLSPKFCSLCFCFSTCSQQKPFNIPQVHSIQPPLTCLFTVEVSLGKQGVLQYHNLHLGSFVHAEEEIQMTNSIPNFIGSIQKFVFNNEKYFELAWDSALQLGKFCILCILNSTFGSRLYWSLRNSVDIVIEIRQAF